jgi:hypothetical protein
MGTRHKPESDIDGFRPRISRCHWRDAFDVGPKLISSLVQYETGAVVGECDVAEIRLNAVRARNLCHRPMVAAMPALKLFFVAGTTLL